MIGAGPALLRGQRQRRRRQRAAIHRAHPAARAAAMTSAAIRGEEAADRARHRPCPRIAGGDEGPHVPPHQIARQFRDQSAQPAGAEFGSHEKPRNQDSVAWICLFTVPAGFQPLARAGRHRSVPHGDAQHAGLRPPRIGDREAQSDGPGEARGR